MDLLRKHTAYGMCMEVLFFLILITYWLYIYILKGCLVIEIKFISEQEILRNENVKYF